VEALSPWPCGMMLTSRRVEERVTDLRSIRPPDRQALPNVDRIVAAAGGLLEGA
jgi:hypothetical protein